MIKRILLSFAFCLCAASAVAADRQFPDFSVDVPAGWEIMGEEPVADASERNVTIINQAVPVAVMVTFGSTEGFEEKDIQAIKEAFKTSAEQQSLKVEIIKDEQDSAVYQGDMAKLILRRDIAAKQMATLVIVGNVAEAETMTKSIKVKNGKLAFY